MKCCLVLLSLVLFVLVGAQPDRVYLASFPRSGNHWVRYLIEEATGVMTFCVNPDGRSAHREPMLVPHDLLLPEYGYAPSGGYLGNRRPPESGEPVVVKTHFPWWNREFDGQPYRLAICLIRNPREAIRSLWQFFSDVEEDELAYKKRQIDLYRSWIEHWEEQPNTLFVRHEDLMENPDQVFREILEEAGFKVSEEDLSRALVAYAPRPSRMGGAETIPAALEDYYQWQLGPILERYGYGTP